MTAAHISCWDKGMARHAFLYEITEYFYIFSVELKFTKWRSAQAARVRNGEERLPGERRNAA
ncbi:hypothetical protein [uncultured Mailhella sp.]|uniref:hypothetical protein n=1 Tax=uncultured Mailhella sp. TaxID=1981031 RepID=UPI0025F719AC|nr:hypothetical protein [uncultured Mailhella sp.]